MCVGEIVHNSPNKKYKDNTGCSRSFNEHTDRLTYRHGDANIFIFTNLRYGSAKIKKINREKWKTRHSKGTYDAILRHVFVITANRNK